MSFYKLVGVVSFVFLICGQSPLWADGQSYGPRVTIEDINRIKAERQKRQNEEIDAKQKDVERIYYSTNSKEEFEAAMRGYEAADDKATFVDTVEKAKKPEKVVPPFYASPVFKLLGFMALFFLLGVVFFGFRKKKATS